jgi:type 1 fimbria pilin
MSHWRTLQDNDNRYVASFDLQGKDVTVTIKDVKSEKVDQQKGGQKRKVIIYFDGKEKPFLANTTNCKTIASMYGTEVEKWSGKSITLFPTTTSAFGEVVECIRVRPAAGRPA